MKESIYKSYDELPLFLNAKTISKLLTAVYEMMHQKDFPLLRLGNRMVVPKEKFKEWVEKNSGGNH